MVFDGNEIMARNNGATARLFLNNEGGDVVFGGGIEVNGESTIDLGYEIVEITEEDRNIAARCPSGKRVVGGGCAAGGFTDSINTSKPQTDGRGWFCIFETGLIGTGTNTAYAICINVP